jgi:hypothetical protein
MFLLWISGASLAACAAMGFMEGALRGFAAALNAPEPIPVRANVVSLIEARRRRAA